MSIKLGNKLLAGIATETKANANSLLDWKWSDHILNEMSWLRGDTFSWQSGDVYVAAYGHLQADYAGATQKTETVGSYTITCYEATDGHKIVLADQETTVANIYAESGVAWFYILDTTNTRFKLPIINPAREELIQILRAKGDGKTLGLTDGTYNGGFVLGTGQPDAYTTSYGADVGSSPSGGSPIRTGKAAGVTTDSEKSGIISNMTDSTSVYKGKKYLYFYVGQFSQSATEQTAGLNASLFNGKVDLNAQNLSDEGKSLIAGLGMPSNTYEDLTLGASGTTYTAPANGWFFLAKVAGGTNQYISLGNSTTKLETTVQPYVNNAILRVYLPAKKGDTIFAEYNASGALRYFRFIYAVGSESEAS